jgi:transcriptional regulator with XRE-family HTH domain
VAQNRTDVGRQLRRAREARGLSQVALAELLGVGERSVQAWERNERHPRLDALEEVARALGQPVAYFYGADQPAEAAA